MDKRGIEIGGVALMVGSVFCIALGSIFAQPLLQEMATAQVLWLRFAGFVVAMAPVVLAMCGRAAFTPPKPGRQLLRGGLGAGVAFCLLLAIRDIGVSGAVAAFYVYPAIGYAIGIAWLGERPSATKWAAVAIGFFGAMVVVAPSIGGTGAGAAFAVLAAALTSLRAALYRQDRGGASPMVSVLWDRAVGAVLATAALPFLWTPIANDAVLAVAGLVGSSVAAQLLLVYALGRAPLGVLAPFAFWEVIFAIALDVQVLGADFTWRAAAGAGLIAAAGVLLAVRRKSGRSPGAGLARAVALLTGSSRGP